MPLLGCIPPDKDMLTVSESAAKTPIRINVGRTWLIILHHTSRIKPTFTLGCLVPKTLFRDYGLSRLTVEQKDSSKARDMARGAFEGDCLFPQKLK